MVYDNFEMKPLFIFYFHLNIVSNYIKLKTSYCLHVRHLVDPMENTRKIRHKDIRLADKKLDAKKRYKESFK